MKLQWTQGCVYAFKLVFQISLDTAPEVESLGHKAVPFYISEVAPYCFPQWLHQSGFPPAVHKVPLFSTSLPVLVVCWLIDDHRHSDRHEVISHYSFNLHLFICLLAILVLFGKCQISSFAHFLIGLFGFLVLSFKSYL